MTEVERLDLAAIDPALLNRLEGRYGPASDPACQSCGSALYLWTNLVQGGAERYEVWRCPTDRLHPTVSVYPSRRDRDVLELVRILRDAAAASPAPAAPAD